VFLGDPHESCVEAGQDPKPLAGLGDKLDAAAAGDGEDRVVPFQRFRKTLRVLRIALALEGLLIDLDGPPPAFLFIRIWEARRATSFAPPAAHTVTHSLQPTRRILSQDSIIPMISSKGFLSATIIKAP
jgi:hypothetical protein